MQIDRPERGFSFRHDGPLDMRMSRDGPRAADLVNDVERRIACRHLRLFGEERHAGRIARAIVGREGSGADPHHARAAPNRRRGGAAEPATASIRRPAPSRRCASRSTTSSTSSCAGLSMPPSVLEAGRAARRRDLPFARGSHRQAFLSGERPGASSAISRHLPTRAPRRRAFAPIHGPVTPGEAELARNPRARSAKLRCGERGTSPLPATASREACRPAAAGQAPRRRRK